MATEPTERLIARVEQLSAHEESFGLAPSMPDIPSRLKRPDSQSASGKRPATLEGLDRSLIREGYNGYNWTGEAVYNPFDLLLHFFPRLQGPPALLRQNSRQPQCYNSV